MKALELALELDSDIDSFPPDICHDAAILLRQQHEALVKALEALDKIERKTLIDPPSAYQWIEISNVARLSIKQIKGVLE